MTRTGQIFLNTAAVLVYGAACLGAVLAMAFLAAKYGEYRETAPCKSFAQESTRNVPVRCLEYFTKGVAQ